MKDYIYLCTVSESNPMEALQRINQDPRLIRLLHGAMGAATESGELVDSIKRNLFYGKELDIINLVEEIGDILWYLSILLDCVNSSFEEAMRKNIDKLRVRYPNKFTNSEAINRDLAKEREQLQRI